MGSYGGAPSFPNLASEVDAGAEKVIQTPPECDMAFVHEKKGHCELPNLTLRLFDSRLIRL